MEKFDLHDNQGSDAVALSLKNALSNTNTMKTLVLCNMGSRGTIARTIRQLLQSPTCMLESLDLSNNKFNCGELESLIYALAIYYRRLRELNLSGSSHITPVVWWALIRLIQSPTCMLESLKLGQTRCNDGILDSLTNALSNNSRLTELDLRSMVGNVTANGWQTFVPILRNPNISLEKLDLSDNGIRGHVMDSLADALANNSRLKGLFVFRGYNVHNIIDNPGAFFSRILCNTSSIMNTYNSNHTLEEL